jgi:hypothetical protein
LVTASATTTALLHRDPSLDGVILDEQKRRALRVAAENVPGVKAVVDHIVWVARVELPRRRASSSAAFRFLLDRREFRPLCDLAQVRYPKAPRQSIP